MLSLLLLLAVVLSAVNAHAILKVPTSWAVAPSKSSPCGNGVPTGVVAQYTAGSNVTLTWQVIAGDGTGPITVKFDTTGGQSSFTTQAVVYGPTPTAVTTYSININIPSGLVCPSCTMQVYSSTAWYSCATVAVVAPAPSPSPTPAPTPLPTGCALAGNLSFCSTFSYLSLIANTSSQLVSKDAGISRTYNEIFATGSSVFTTLTPACLSLYAQYLCTAALPRCGSPVACTSALCYALSPACHINASHSQLFDCAGQQSSQGATCSVVSASAALWPASLVVVCLMGLISALF